MLNKIIFHSLLLLISSSTAYSQKLVFQNLGVKQGLPAMEVYNLFQDREGYIWVFTEYGIVKHNGSKFIPVCRNLPLKESAIYAVAKSKYGELFIANSKGKIYQVQGDKAFKVKGLEKYTQEIRSTSEPILNLFLDKRNTLYFSIFQKTYAVSEREYELTGTNKPKKIVRTAGPEYIFPVRMKDPVTGKLYLSLRDSSGNSIRKIYRDFINASRTFAYRFNGNTYLTWMHELMLYTKNGTKKHYNFGRGIVNLKIAPDGHIWVGIAGGGLYEFDKDLNLLQHYLENVTVSDILFDDQSGLWVSTIGEGVYYCSNTDNLSFYNIPELNSQVNALKAIGNKLFIGTTSGRIFVYEKEAFREISLDGNRFTVNDFIEFEGRYYIGTKGLIYVIGSDLRLLEIIREAGYNFLKASDGSLIIVSGSRILRRKKNSKIYEVAYANTWNRCIIERDPGEFFVIIYRGEELCRFKSGFSNAFSLKKLKGKNISRIKADAEKNIWICTKGEGLYRLTRKNKLVHYGNLPSGIINDVCFLSDSVVVLATNKGAFVSTQKQLRNKASWKQLLDEEALRVTSFDDQVMIGSASGLISLKVDKLFRVLKYRFYLSTVEKENRKISLARLSQLNYRENDLYFNYDLLAYAEPSKQLYYTVNGPSSFDGKVDGTQVHLQNLSPGHYTLCVYPLVDQLHGKHLRVVTKFYIKPAFWQTSFFLVAMIISGFALTVLCSWLIMRAKRKRELERSKIEKLLAEYRLTALKAQVNPHFMSNSLVAIQLLIMKKETAKANQYLAKFSLLIRYLLDYSDQSVTSLYSELKMIDLYVELEQLRFDNQFRFVKEVAKNIQADQLYIPALITQPLIENAIWHGLLPLSGERIQTLTLSITMDHQALCISITDNGVGRHSLKLHPEKSRPFKESKGVSLIEKRIENLNKLYTPAKSSFEFVDLFDEAGKPCGSTVLLFFSLDMINKLYDEGN